MPVSIGEFEVVSSPEPTPAAAGSTLAASTPPIDTIQLQALQQALHELALRCWSH